MSIEIRECRADELESAQRVAGEAFSGMRHVYRPSAESVANKRKIEPYLHRLLALEDSDVLGTVQYRIVDDRLHFLGLAVAMRKRRAGVARAMIDRLRDIAVQQHCRRVSLYTIEETGNVTIFEHLGFEVISRGPAEGLVNPSGQPLTEAYMEMRPADHLKTTSRGVSP